MPTNLHRLLLVVVLGSLQPVSASPSGGPPGNHPPSGLEERSAEGARRLNSGDVLGAQQVWRQIESDARLANDEDTLDQAERALADIAFLRGHYAEVAQIHGGRMTRAQASANLQLEADARMQLALIERRQGRLEQAGTELERALEQFRSAGDRDGEGEALTHLGLVLLNQGAFVRAIEVLDQSLALHRAGAAISVDRSYHYLGLLYLSLRDHDEARVHLTRALAAARLLPDPMRASAPLGSLARLSNEQGLHADALDFAAEAQSISERFDSTPGLSFSALERGRALIGLGRLKEARQALQESLALSQSVDQDRTAADAMFSLGRVALGEGDPEAALRLFDQAIPNYEAAGDVPQLLDAYRVMVPLLRERGKLQRALDLSIAAQALLERINGRETSRRIALIEYRHEAQARDMRIAQLASENEVKALRLSRQEFGRQVSIGVICSLVLLIAVLVVLNRRSQRVRRRLAASNLELTERRLELAAANARLDEKARALHIAATTDALTGIANRRHILEVLERAIATSDERNGSVAVLLIDVDRFKAINDRHGHGAGDRVLCRIANTLQSLLPDGAMLGRLGGEEFLLILPDGQLSDAQGVAEAALLGVRTATLAEGPPATLSIGVAVRGHGSGASSVDLIEAADRALYVAKESGRDQLAVATGTCRSNR